jgi:SOS-response transcriptional repressor LexA
MNKNNIISTSFMGASHELTDAQNELYELIIQLFKEKQYMPTVKELADNLGCYPNSVQGKLNTLQDKGFITKSQSKSRSINFTKLKIELVAA